MIVRKVMFGLCAACAMLVCALAAQGAAAADNTAVLCTNSGTPIDSVRFSDLHCKTEAVGGANFHVSTGANGVKVPSKLTNETTEGKRETGILKATVGGLSVEIGAEEVEAEGTIENNVTGGGEMYAEGLTNSIIFKKVKVLNRTCEIFGITPGTGVKTLNEVRTEALRGTTKLEPTRSLVFEPQKVGGKFAEFELTGGSCPAALKGLYPVFGTVTAKTAGATTLFNHTEITGATSLRLKEAGVGPLAGLQGSVTIKRTEGGVPVALT